MMKLAAGPIASGADGICRRRSLRDWQPDTPVVGSVYNAWTGHLQPDSTERSTANVARLPSLDLRVAKKLARAIGQPRAYLG